MSHYKIHVCCSKLRSFRKEQRGQKPSVAHSPHEGCLTSASPCSYASLFSLSHVSLLFDFFQYPLQKAWWGIWPLAALDRPLSFAPGECPFQARGLEKGSDGCASGHTHVPVPREAESLTGRRAWPRATATPMDSPSLLP